MTTSTFKNASVALPQILHELLEEGARVSSRNGDTREVLMNQITLLEPIPAPMTTAGRRASLPAQIAETMWLLAGRNDVKWLSNYLPRAADFSDDGEVWRGAYGPRIRMFGGTQDQLNHVVALLRENPDTRRAVMSIYDPHIDMEPGKDIPCNNWVHFISRGGALHAHVAIRSNDVFWGWSGINTFEWASVLHIVAELLGMNTGSITYSISSLHLYSRHELRSREIADSYIVGGENVPIRQTPQFNGRVAGGTVDGLDRLVERWFKIEALIRSTEHPSGQVRHEIERFPEPMLRSWLEVLFAWHHGDIPRYLGHHKGSALYIAALDSPARKTAEAASAAEVPPRGPVVLKGGFAEATAKLHAEKHAAYGDSWKRRGEMLAIMANIARKVDRLAAPGDETETTADTAQDLLVYLIKYRLWLSENIAAPREDFLPANGYLTDDADYVTAVLASLGDEEKNPLIPTNALLVTIPKVFEYLVPAAEEHLDTRWELVDELIGVAHGLAVRTWKHEQWKKGNATRSWKGYGNE